MVTASSPSTGWTGLHPCASATVGWHKQAPQKVSNSLYSISNTIFWLENKAVPAFWSRFSTCGTPWWLFRFFSSSICPRCQWSAEETCSDTMFTTRQNGFNDERSSPSFSFFQPYLRRAIDVRLYVSVQGGHKVTHGIGSFLHICSFKNKQEQPMFTLTWLGINYEAGNFVSQHRCTAWSGQTFWLKAAYFFSHWLRFCVASGVVIKAQ